MDYMYGGGGGMGGSQMMPMMSSGMSSLVMVSASAGLAYYMYNKNEEEKKKQAAVLALAQANAESAQSTQPVDTSPASHADGTYALMVGTMALTTPSACKLTYSEFRPPQEGKSSWYVRKAGTDDGKTFYTVQSAYKTFNINGCAATYLSAPLSNCRGTPILAPARPGDTRQYWHLEKVGDGVILQNVACKQGKSPSYLQQAGQGQPGGQNNRGIFVPRTGTQFRMQAPYAD